MPSQPRWKWFAREIQIKHGVPSALLIEADTGYILLVSHLAESDYEFSLDLHDALLMSLDIHPDVHEIPHDGMFSFDQDPENIHWILGNADDLALQRRLNEATQQLATMSPAQGHAALAEMNRQSDHLASREVVPRDVMQQRLDHYGALWLRYSENTNFVVQVWNTLRKRKPWVKELMQ